MPIPRKMSGMAINTIEPSIVVMRVPIVVLTRATHLYPSDRVDSIPSSFDRSVGPDRSAAADSMRACDVVEAMPARASRPFGELPLDRIPAGVLFDGSRK